MEEMKNLSNQAIGKVHGPIYTSKEVEELGIPSTQPVPKPEKCKYCGKTLYYECVVLMGQAMIWNLEKPRCDCEKAVAFWKGWDAKQEKIKKEKELAEEQELRKQKIESILGKSGIKKRYLSRTIDSFSVTAENKKSFEVATDYIKNFREYFTQGKGLYLEGPCGTGKTHLAIAIALAIINTGVPVICKTSIDILGDIKRCYERNSEVTEEEVLEAYKTVDLLIIDDLGKEQVTEWSVPVLYSILNERYEALLPTIITTNYNTTALAEKLSAKGDAETATAIISRFVESSKRVTMSWADYRRKG
ncbi:MAG: ATP-binding protein [[Eubacterium] siraeum]|jgi:DNA replication protein DnaC|nr:MAG TPA: Replicative helicase [Caudoviricetes sp.]